MAESQDQDITPSQKINRRQIGSYTARTEILNQVFANSAQEVSSTEAKACYQEYESLLTKECKTWWNLSSLERYMQERIIPRGLRIRKSPSPGSSPEFIEKWNTVLTEASFKLMEVIIQSEQQKLTQIQGQIQDLDEQLNKLEHDSSYEATLSRITNNLDKLEAKVVEIKKSKLQRDRQDYQSNNVYTWKRDKSSSSRKSRSASKTRKQKRTSRRVSFSVSEGSTGPSSESDKESRGSSLSGDLASGEEDSNQPDLQQKDSGKKSKNGEEAESTGGPPSYPLRNRQRNKDQLQS